MRTLLPILLFVCLIRSQACCEIDSLYNSRWKGGLKISITAVTVRGEEHSPMHLLASIPITKNIRHSFFNAESGISAGGFFPIENHSQNYPQSQREYFLGLPLKIKYDRDGMFLASGISNWYAHSRFSGTDFYGDPIAYSTDNYFLKFNFTMGFEKYVDHDCEIFVDVFYERTLIASPDPHHLLYESSLHNIGFSLGFFIRSN
jgi:hypothetical protein